MLSEQKSNIQSFSEANEAPADLNKPIVFKAPSKSNSDESHKDGKDRKRPSSSSDNRKPKRAKGKLVLSFDEEENDE